MKQFSIPKKVDNLIDGKEIPANTKQYFKKINPHNGKAVCDVARSDIVDVLTVVNSARKAQQLWAITPPVKRGEVLFEISVKMNE